MAKFKTEFENCTVTVNSPAVGKITINTATVNPNHWVNVKEFAFMFEVETAQSVINDTPSKVNNGLIANIPKKEIYENPTKENVIDFIQENNGLIADSYADFTLNELRERFPNIKATSKKAFIEQITE
jgi:hypothetical protein